MTTLEYFFEDWDHLITIDISGMDTSKLTNMSSAFFTVGWTDEFCDMPGSLLREVKLGDIDTSNVTDMSGMFYMCWNLEKVDLENLDTENVTNMNGMFSGCGLQEIDLSHFDMSKVEEAILMFYATDNFSNVLLVQKIHTPLNLTIDVDVSSTISTDLRAFQDAEGNIYETLPKNMSKSIIIEYGMKPITGGDGQVHSGTSNDISWEIDEKGHLSVSGKGDLYFDEETWYYNSWLEYSDIIVSAEFDVDQMTDVTCLFDYHYYLKTLDMSKFDMSDVVDEYGEGLDIFYDCYSLEKIKTPVNLAVDIALPTDQGQVWVDENGNVYEYLPKNLSTSITLTSGNASEEDECETNGHSWDAGKVTIAATCNKEGVKTYTCTMCSETKAETIAKTAHTWNKDYTTTKEPTCTEKGSKNIQCSVCKAVKDGSTTEIAAKGHSYTSKVTAPTETEKGYTTYTCSICNHTYKDNYTDPTGSGNTESNNAGFGTENVYRVSGKSRYDTAFETADALKKQLGVEKFNTVIIACGTNFADALAGSYLAGVKDAPILMSNKDDTKPLKDYIAANVNKGGTIYLLGGTAAIPENVMSGVSGYTIKRLSGKSRYETNLAILEEAGVSKEDIIVCTGTGFADSLSASALGKPILLVGDKLTDGQKAFLGKLSGNKYYIIGGTGAVKPAIENEIKAYGTPTRLGGKTRYQTSVLVAETFFSSPKTAVLAYAMNFPDGLAGGPLAMSKNAPLILTATGNEDVAAAYTKANEITKGAVLGGSGLISDSAVKNIFYVDKVVNW